MNPLSFLTTPSPSINYSVITTIYLACFLLFSLFYLLELYLDVLGKEHWAYDNMDSVRGVYIIGVPFAPFTAWAAFMMYRQGMSGGYVELGSEARSKMGEKKKDK